MSEKTWDFIIVGSGPAGSALASKLALTPSRPSILLLEAGPPADDISLRVDGQRWATHQREGTNWGYKTTPQEHCNNRSVDYSRGRILGGSSAINFGIFTVGARDDYEVWSELVDDETFNWANISRRYKALENFDFNIVNPEHRHFANPKEEDHGKSGPLKLGFAREWEQDLPPVMEAFREAGVDWNPDHNSGNPLGVSLAVNSVHEGLRTTAKDLLDDAFSKGASQNLEIRTGKTVRRVVLEGQRIVGVETVEDEVYLANKETILSAGSLDTPKILMHSGLGPAEQLQKFNIPVVRDIPYIGQNLQDHALAPLMFLRTPSTNTRNAFFNSEEAKAAALEQWHVDKTGPWTLHNAQLMVGWLKSDTVSKSPEFTNLPQETKQMLNRPTIPHYEICSHFPIHEIVPEWGTEFSYICFLAFLMNGQSRGEVTLQSADPTVPLLFNPNFLSHEYDRRVCIEAMRELKAVTDKEAFAKDTVAMMLGPKSDSDEDILEHWRNVVGSTWHMTGTVKMGKDSDKEAVVDTRFRLKGFEGLRVVDMSVVPVLTTGHTQATAYVTGITAAEVLAKEYSL
ncbi:hypothetical protein BJY04DRAFT_197300 [Aspergillus karnatakaensis]|uniref:GMC family oxidoreductase n=1 Tax=Aspergillus karnatakaensis TaxID=1810916 RepID=UPI003CCD458B